MKANKQFFAVKVPGGFLKSVCEVTGQIEVTKDIHSAEWNNQNVSRALAHYALGVFPESKRFQVYSFAL